MSLAWNTRLTSDIIYREWQRLKLQNLFCYASRRPRDEDPTQSAVLEGDENQHFKNRFSIVSVYDGYWFSAVNKLVEKDLLHCLKISSIFIGLKFCRETFALFSQSYFAELQDKQAYWSVHNCRFVPYYKSSLLFSSILQKDFGFKIEEAQTSDNAKDLHLSKSIPKCGLHSRRR